MTIKILWCDRNYDYVESFIEATKPMFQNVEFVLKKEPVDAIKEILTNKNEYKLIISGQIFKNMAGTDLFEIIFNNKIQIPFLLLTAQVDYNQFSSYDMWGTFNYMDKLKCDFYQVANTIKDLVNRDITATFYLHEKLSYLRNSLHLSTKQMSAIVGVSESEVINSESDYSKVTSSYITLLSRQFDIPLSTLVQSSLSYFQEMVDSRKPVGKDKYGV